MESCAGGERWWRVVLVENSSGGEWCWWRVVLMASDVGGEWCWWSVLVASGVGESGADGE